MPWFSQIPGIIVYSRDECVILTDDNSLESFDLSTLSMGP